MRVRDPPFVGLHACSFRFCGRCPLCRVLGAPCPSVYVTSPVGGLCLPTTANEDGAVTPCPVPLPGDTPVIRLSLDCGAGPGAGPCLWFALRVVQSLSRALRQLSTVSHSKSPMSFWTLTQTKAPHGPVALPEPSPASLLLRTGRGGAALPWHLPPPGASHQPPSSLSVVLAGLGLLSLLRPPRPRPVQGSVQGASWHPWLRPSQHFRRPSPDIGHKAGPRPTQSPTVPHPTAPL